MTYRDTFKKTGVDERYRPYGDNGQRLTRPLQSLRHRMSRRTVMPVRYARQRNARPQRQRHALTSGTSMSTPPTETPTPHE
jgi:hypothetical protein